MLPKIQLSRPQLADLPASLVVFLVAVPLSLGIALASGAPILAGLIGAAVGGIVVGLFGGAPLQVSGPAAGLTVVVFGIISKFGFPTMCLITVIAGLLQIGFGLFKVARVSLAISPAVVHGMLAGIGIVIALAQAHVVLGGKPESSALVNLGALPQQVADLHGASTQLGILAFLILVVWNYLPKRIKAIPGPLVAVVVPTVLSLWISDAGLKRVKLPDSLLPTFELPTLAPNLFGPIAIAAATVAIVASVESLLSAVATDAMHMKRRANLDKELVGQGLGNMVSGALGGLPVTGVIVRSSANVAAGAATKWSAILHGVWVLVFAAVGAALLESIPLSVLAGLLVYVGMRLVKAHDIKELAKHGELPIYLVTVAGVVGKDLLFGVGAGIVLAMVFLIYRLSHVKIGRMEPVREGGPVTLTLDGSLSFLSVPKLTSALQTLPEGVPVRLDMHTDLMDHAAFDALHSWVSARRSAGGTVEVVEHVDDWYSLALSDAPTRRVKTSLTLPASRNGVGDAEASEPLAAGSP